LWFAFPALLTVTAGVAMVFEHGLEQGLNAELAEPTPPVGASDTGTIGFANALAAAQRAFPSSSFSGVALPSAEEPWYRVRLRNAGEVPRKWGTTVVWVSAGDGRILGRYDAAAPKPGRAVTDTFYALHTGQIGMLPGRAIVLAIGLCLLALIGLGIPLWWKRRAVKRPRAEA
jgi:uncharacterized iron-regulated membrane protein